MGTKVSARAAWRLLAATGDYVTLSLMPPNPTEPSRLYTHLKEPIPTITEMITARIRIPAPIMFEDDNVGMERRKREIIRGMCATIVPKTKDISARRKRGVICISVC